MHCGFCTATCPTFLLLGDELDSPRGRIYLIKDMLESGRPATEEVVRHIDRCLSCLSCMTTCPSGVHYMHLVDHARTHIERTYRRPWHERAAARACWPRCCRVPGCSAPALLAGARAGVGRCAGLIPAAGPFGQRLRAMLALAPARLPPPEPRLRRRACIRRRARAAARVALLAGCAQQVLAPEINEATIRLLTRLGVEVVVARGRRLLRRADPPHGPPRRRDGRGARQHRRPGAREIDGEGLDAIVINTSGCGTTVKDYGFMFRTEPRWRARGRAGRRA